MALHVTIEDNRYMERFFRDFSQYADEIKENIYHTLPELIAYRPDKIKAAYHLKRDDHTILEYKVVVSHANFRAAYTRVGDDVNVFFISKTTIKRFFVSQLESTSLVDNH